MKGFVMMASRHCITCTIQNRAFPTTFGKLQLDVVWCIAYMRDRRWVRWVDMASSIRDGY